MSTAESQASRNGSEVGWRGVTSMRHHGEWRREWSYRDPALKSKSNRAYSTLQNSGFTSNENSHRPSRNPRETSNRTRSKKVSRPAPSAG